MIIGPTIATWHKDELALSAALIVTFVDTVESQAAESMAQYRKGKQTKIVEYEDGENSFTAAIEEYRGLNSELWDLESLFEEYFPSLLRRSALLTVWGYFEHELDKLCSLYKSERRFILGVSDIEGKGIDRSTKYLAKVAGLNVHHNTEDWREINRIRELRNKIAHQDGRLITTKGQPALNLISYVEQSPFLKKDGHEVVLKEGFLKHVVDTFAAYFKLIGDSIKENTTAIERC